MHRYFIIAAFVGCQLTQATLPFGVVTNAQPILDAPGKPLPEKCADYTGNWKGTCTSGAITQPTPTVSIIQAACVGISVRSSNHPLLIENADIGMLGTESRSARFLDDSTILIAGAYSYWWASDTTTLHRISVSLAKPLDSGNALAYLTQMTMRLDGKRLYVKIERDRGGDNGPKPLVETCVYDKQ